jgi:hypothetical protein
MLPICQKDYSYMSRGPSGRLVVELEPTLKQQLYSALALDGMTFKDWLTRQAEHYISEHKQPQLFAAEPSSPAYKKSRDRTRA